MGKYHSAAHLHTIQFVLRCAHNFLTCKYHRERCHVYSLPSCTNQTISELVASRSFSSSCGLTCLNEHNDDAASCASDNCLVRNSDEDCPHQLDFLSGGPMEVAHDIKNYWKVWRTNMALDNWRTRKATCERAIVTRKSYTESSNFA
eukprot:1157528-Pelagomonas_calceolata.AAC.9